MATVTLITDKDTVTTTVPQAYGTAVDELTGWGWRIVVGNEEKSVLANDDNWAVIVEA